MTIKLYDKCYVRLADNSIHGPIHCTANFQFGCLGTYWNEAGKALTHHTPDVTAVYASLEEAAGVFVPA